MVLCSCHRGRETLSPSGARASAGRCPMQVALFKDATVDRRPSPFSETRHPHLPACTATGRSAREPPRLAFWVVARYDWSDPHVVRWTVTESGYGGTGRRFVRVAPEPAVAAEGTPRGTTPTLAVRRRFCSSSGTAS